ncbi:Transcriptional regulator, contains XRE-family HTH domain [Paraburkholderia steynii]|uniref:Transcriptional regulator, contains XRE-family HTH domain n=1 Tax=Paraburkholderia steynii TaxID=1245441 RepID=A0A7Z7BDB7_9BURK|nr:helix-turn-helix transcriptional regulator [Paraburkholderia steynii]SDI70248.1 Transcriptional regulator, contains XRE-family HTH domain [Paraburkholderia steynii]
MIKKEPATVFGRRLRAARLRADIPQDKLGVKIGLDEGTASVRVSRYETGVHEPPFGIALKLAAALRIPAAYFYCEDDELADVVLAWGRLTKSERKRIKPLITAELEKAKGAG